jgi:hypothetical protein
VGEAYGGRRNEAWALTTAEIQKRNPNKCRIIVIMSNHNGAGIMVCPMLIIRH